MLKEATRFLELIVERSSSEIIEREKDGAVVVAKLVEQLLPTPEIRFESQQRLSFIYVL